MTRRHPPGALVRVPVRLSRRGVVTLVLLAGFALSLLGVEWTANSNGLDTLGEILAAALRPDLSPSFLHQVGRAALITLAYATTGMTVAVVVGIPAALVASGVLARGRLARVTTAGVTRASLAVLRAPDEIVWALLFVQVFGFSPWAGVLAIGLPYGATIGRVLAERLQDVPDEPLAALRNAGASPWQVLFYGRLPQVAPDVVAYVSYRYECAVRAAAILSVVGLPGIGLQIDIALDDLLFDRVWTLAAALAVLIVMMDAASARVRAWMAP